MNWFAAPNRPRLHPRRNSEAAGGASLRLELHAHRRADVDLVSGRLQLAALRVDREHDQRMSVLVRHDHVLAGRVDTEVAWDLDSGALPRDEGQFAIVRI